MQKLTWIALAIIVLPMSATAQQGQVDRARERADEMSAPDDMAVDDMAIESSDSELLPAPEVDDGAVLLDSPNAVSMGVPDEYIIQPGDTLWDICARILGDPFQWPKLWSFNQYITNPHWIYPGNVLRFVPGTETEPPRFEVTKPDEIDPNLEPVDMMDEIEDDAIEDFTMSPEPESGGLDKSDFEDSRPKSFDIKLRQEGFIAESRISPLGKVHRSENPARNLGEGDELYLKFRDPGLARVGQKFTVYRQIRRVRHPVKHNYIGYLIRILGQVEVIEASEQVATAKIVTSYDAITRGDPVTEYVSMVKTVNVTPNRVQLDGHIVETLADGVQLIGDRDVIYVDRGAQDGVRIGNKLQVVRKGDGLLQDTKGLPEETVGELVIVGTRANTSTAVVTEATRALQLGDRFVMK